MKLAQEHFKVLVENLKASTFVPRVVHAIKTLLVRILLMYFYSVPWCNNYW